MGLLGDVPDPLAGLLQMGPEQIRALREQQARQNMTAGRAPPIIGAPSGVVRAPNSGLGEGLGAIGQGLKAFAEGRQKSQQADMMKRSVDAALGRGAGVRNAALEAGGGPTNEAATYLDRSSPIALPPQARAMMSNLADAC